MSVRRPSRIGAYSIATLSVVAALVGRMALDHVLTERQPFPTFFLAVTIAAWFGGFGPAVLTLVLGWLCAYYFFMVPRYSFGVAHPDMVASVPYIVVGLTVAALIDSIRRAQARAEQQAQALQGSEARLKGVITSATDAIVTIDADQKITLFNAGAEAIFGYPAQAMMGRTLDPLIPERFREIHRQHINVFAETDVARRSMGAERVLAGLRRNGEEFPIDAHISQVEIGGRKLYTVILRDITERRHAQVEREELLATTERARGEAERALDVVGRIQSITQTVLADLPFEQLLQELVRRVQVVLMADTALISLEKDGVLYVRAAVGLEAEVRNGEGVRIGIGFVGQIAKERQPLILDAVGDDQLVNGDEKGLRSFAGVPLISGESRVLGVLHVGSRKPRKFSGEEVRLLQLAAERVALGVERAARMEVERRMYTELEAASRAKDEFLAMLSHELRNPLAAVQNAIVTAKLDQSRRGRALEVAHRQTEQLGRLIDDLLDVARITQGRITLRTETVHLTDIIQGAIEATRSLVEQHWHELSVSFASGDDIRLVADPARVEQIAVNLLTNAVKYMEPGGRIVVSVERQGNEAVFRIGDSGIGIAPDMLPRVFDLFAQAARGLDRAQGGLGIGLTVVRRLVQLHGGRVEARSAGIGKGAEFIVRLPALPPTHGEATERHRTEATLRFGARVLLVEDNPDAAEALTMLLELLGHQVRVAADGATALDLAQTHVPDVMLIDIGLPGMDGYEVARRMRQHPDLKGVILVALTGYGREEDRQHAFAAGFDYHLVKPVHPDALQGLVTRLGSAKPGKPPIVH